MEQLRTPNRARRAFEAVRPDGRRDAEAAYLRDPTLARDAAKGQLGRSILYRKTAEGTRLSQLRISVHGAGWRESEIDRWIADPVAWRPEGEGR